MNKKVHKKTPKAVLQRLAALKHQESELMMELDRVRSEMTLVNKIQRTESQADIIVKLLDDCVRRSLTRAPSAQGGKKHKDALIQALTRNGPMRLKDLTAAAIGCGAETNAKRPADSFHAVLHRNPETFFRLYKGNAGVWGLTQRYRDKNFR